MSKKFLGFSLFILLFSSNVWAQSCYLYFKKIDLATPNDTSEFSDLIAQSAKRLNEIEVLRHSDKMDNDYAMGVYQVIMNHLRLEMDLRDRIEDVYLDLVDSLANPRLEGIRTEDLVGEALLVQATLDAKQNTSKASIGSESGNVRVLNADVFQLNRRYQDYLNRVHNVISSYLKRTDIEKDVVLERMNFLLMADVRFEKLDAKGKEALVSVLQLAALYGHSTKESADTFFRYL